jgi:DNA-directed RNA polymerase subunit RPC12/RpoP
MTDKKMMTLYICTGCNLLLTSIEKRYHVYYDCYLDNAGEYIDDFTNDQELDAYVCPECGNTYVLDTNNFTDMKSIVLPLSLAKKLNSIFSSLSQEEKRRSGIPLANQTLKELLTEYLL